MIEETTKLLHSDIYDDNDDGQILEKSMSTPLRAKNGLFEFLDSRDYRFLAYLLVSAFIVRLAFLSHPGVVVFDEVHFGGFAKKYLNREFFNDLHPPLARLLVTLSAWVGGFDGKFSFYDIGANYLSNNVPYVIMRAFTAVSGVLVIPISFITMRGMGINSTVAATMSAMLIFDNALTTQSRLILLDSYLVLFTSMTALFWVVFKRTKPFTAAWHIGLLGIGTSFALAASSKWVGFFSAIAVGIISIAELWNILGDTRVSIKDFSRHLVSRVVGLIVLPSIIYMSTFWIHFSILQKHSGAAVAFSIEFQQTLKGGELKPTLEQIYFGSNVRIRQNRSSGPFIHSHAHFWPAGSKQQQVTGYHHRDSNNIWTIRRPNKPVETETKNKAEDSVKDKINDVIEENFGSEDVKNHDINIEQNVQEKENIFYHDEEATIDEVDETEELVPLRHGDIIRLQHVATDRFLHSHPIAPPISNKEKQYEVSAYGSAINNSSDSNDNWRIEIVDAKGDSITAEEEYTGEPLSEERKNQLPILAMGTRFRLVHANISCKLHCRNKALPEYAFKQSEITCGTETLRANQIWMIEENNHPLSDTILDKKMAVPKKIGFWKKFLETNISMWRSNSELGSDHPFASRPLSWPLLSRGVGFWNGNQVPKIEKKYMNKLKPISKDSQGQIVDNEDQDSEDDLQEQAQLKSEYERYKSQQIHLIGNPVIWWAASGSIVLFLLTLVTVRLIKRRSISMENAIENSAFRRLSSIDSFGGFFFVQWLWHFVPFFGMNRQLFLHHYIPAFYFSVILMALLLDSILTEGCRRLPKQMRPIVRGVILSTALLVTIYVFYKFAPLAYGLEMSRSQCEALKWNPNWDFDCEGLTDAPRISVT